SSDGPICLVVVTSDRGLAGSFNTNILRQAESFLAQHPSSDVVAVGKKAQDFFKARGVAASFADFSDIATLPEIAPLADWLLSRYENHTYDSIVFCSTNFVSALSQKVEHTDVLPLTVEGLLSIIERIVPKTGRYSGLQNGEEKETPFALFEPSATEVFEAIVPELVRVEILHLMFESAASEHASRMVAMKAATESADDIISELGLELNKARQAGITQELAEISTAKEALSHE
ncbi:MAG: FoF1 ATP synthase subunit gamma, partial [Candidatus Pacearchaeota archaeon]|nr:FoF1 ATP synthase subunit gamma [Candidatus Pacearchaeota archaeon]